MARREIQARLSAGVAAKHWRRRGLARRARRSVHTTGGKLVQVVGGASVVQQLLGAGLVDELHLDIMPVVFGAGLRLFEHLDPGRLRLEKLRVQEVGARTSLAFGVMNR